MPSLDLAALNKVDRAAFTAALGHLFEHSPWVAEEAWVRRPFRDAEQLHRELCAMMRAAPRERQRALIQAHPDLAGRMAQAQTLTVESTREQASAGLNALRADEMKTFRSLNEAYRSRFDFPFIICARLNAKDAIVSAMQSRLSNSPETEFQTALSEIEKIARLRLDDVLKAG